MMVVGACICLAVAESAGLNPLEIAGNFVIKCHLSFSKLKEVVQKLKRWSRNTINNLKFLNIVDSLRPQSLRGN